MSRQKNKYKIAELNIVMTTEQGKTLRQAEPYKVKNSEQDFDEAEISIEVPEDFLEMKKEQEFQTISSEDFEYVTTGGLFYRYLLRYHGLMLHSSAVVVDGYAYLFSADSGTGKSTHTGLWMKYFGDRAFIINDDKPAIRKIDDKWYVYGTPWSGKTDKNVNTKAELGAIVFIERSEENWIEEMEPKEAIPKFFAQTTRRLYKEANMDLLLTTLDELLREAPLYKMGCNISEEAVVTAYEKIRRV